jgi:hypothetical protein
MFRTRSINLFGVWDETGFERHLQGDGTSKPNRPVPDSGGSWCIHSNEDVSGTDSEVGSAVGVREVDVAFAGKECDPLCVGCIMQSRIDSRS